MAQATNGTPTTPIKQERLFVTPQMQPQVLNLQNLQGIPQQFIQVFDFVHGTSNTDQRLLIPSIKNSIHISTGRTIFAECRQRNVPSYAAHANGYR